MLVVYESMTGNTEKFVSKLPFNYTNIENYDGITPFVLVTYTINFGSVPTKTEQFLSKYSKNMLGVSSGGNKNWGNTFAIAANKIAEKYKVPIINKFELQGTKQDVNNFIKGVEFICLNG